MKIRQFTAAPVSLIDFAKYMGVNESVIHLAIEDGKITACSIHGDVFMIDNVNTAINELLMLLKTARKELIDSLDEDENLLRSMEIPMSNIYSSFGGIRTTEQLQRSEHSKYLFALFAAIPKYLHEGLTQKKKLNAQWKLIKARLRIYRAEKARRDAWLNLISVEYMIFIHGKICSFDLNFNSKIDSL